MNKISLMPSLLSATGWFIGLLVVMIIVTALFAVVLVIALKPIKKYEPADDMPKKLERRETELTIQLLKNSNDPKRTEMLLKELRGVTEAEKLVNRIIDEENAAAKRADGKNKAPAKKTPPKGAPAQPQQQPKPAQQAQPQQQPKPQQGAPAQPQQQPKPAQQAQPAQPQQQPKPAQQAQPQPQQPAQPQQKAPQQGAPAQQAKPQQQTDKK